MDELSCSIVVMNGSQPKVLRLNLGGHSDELQTPFFSSSSSPGIQTGKLKGRRLKHSTPVGSPDVTGSSVTRSIGVDSMSLTSKLCCRAVHYALHTTPTILSQLF
jgi:hypothetical protein